MSFNYSNLSNNFISRSCRTAIYSIILFSFLNGLSIAQQQTYKPEAIDKNAVVILVRSTIAAIDHANKTGIYSVLRNLGSPKFQTNDEQKLSEIFLNLRRDKIDLSGTAAIEPYLTTPPELLQNGMLHFGGYFPSAPLQVYFDLTYEAVGSQWRLYGVSVVVGPSIPVVVDTKKLETKKSDSNQPNAQTSKQ